MMSLFPKKYLHNLSEKLYESNTPRAQRGHVLCVVCENQGVLMTTITHKLHMIGFLDSDISGGQRI